MKTISGPRYPVEPPEDHFKPTYILLRFHTVDASSICGESFNCSLKTKVGKIKPLVITACLIRGYNLGYHKGKQALFVILIIQIHQIRIWYAWCQ